MIAEGLGTGQADLDGDGQITLRELADAGILRWSSRGSMKRYLLDERAAALRRFGELFGFTVA